MSEHEVRSDNQLETDKRELVLRRRTAQDYVKEFKQRHPELFAAASPATETSPDEPDEKDVQLDPATLKKAA